jgi:hypothetical protein
MQAPGAHYAPAANPNVISGTDLFGVVEDGQVVEAQEFMRAYARLCAGMLKYAHLCSRLTYARVQVVEAEDGAHLSADPFQPTQPPPPQQQQLPQEIPDAGALFGGVYESHAGGGTWGGVLSRMLTYADVC